MLKVENMFFVSVKAQEHFDFETNRSKEFRVVYADIMADIHTRIDLTFNLFSFVEAFLSFFMLWIVTE